MRSALVTGGAGYIGSHLCATLKRAGGWFVFSIDTQAPYRLSGSDVVGDILNCSDIEYMGAHRFDVVFHMAALIDVEESEREPDRYRAVNVQGTANLLSEYQKRGTPIVLSSTAAVYETSDQPLREDMPTVPANVYGQTKLEAENLIRESGNPHAILRYFNVAGCSPGMRDNHKNVTHLVPRIIKGGGDVTIMGDDYETRDGTCVRDFVHVQDICDAHLKAAERLLGGKGSFTANLGSGKGQTVREVAEAAQRVLGSGRITTGPRRPGDAASLVADSSVARDLLDYNPKYSLEEMIASHKF